jgi:hypothetical protein
VANAEHTLVLLGRFPGKDRAVAVALARDFGRDDAWGIQVVGAAPIVLLDGLTAEQAQAVHASLADVEAAGSRLEIQPTVDKELAKLSWPAPARIKGKLVSELGSSGASVQGSTATLILPCPYTGQKMKITLNVSISRADGLSVAASAAALPQNASGSGMTPRPISIPIPMPVPTQQSGANNAAYRPIPTPVVSPAAGKAPTAIPTPASQPRKMTPVAGTQQQAVIMGLDSLDELTPMEPEPVAAAAQQRAIPAPAPRTMAVPRPAPVPARSQGGAAPLPDVPVLHNSAPAAPTQISENNSAPMPMDLLSAPMDLSAFEAKVSASGIMRAVQLPPAAPADASGSGVDALPDDDGSLCSVSIGKSGSPKVHQVVAEMQGISVAEAARLCQKPIVTLAKDITVGEARSIKQQLAAVNVVAKITRRT